MSTDPYPGSAAAARLTGPAPAAPDVRDLTVGQLVSQVTSDLTTLMRQEFALAKAEVRQEATKAGRGAGMLGGAGFAGYLVVVFASLALMFALGAAMPLWLAAALVAALYAVAAFLLYRRGRTAVAQFDPTPHQTVETLNELKETVR